MNKIFLLFIVFLCCATFAQSQQGNSPSTLIKTFNQNSKKSLVANDGLITDLRAKINSDESTLSEKSTITDLMLRHFIEKGEFLEFKKLYNQHAVLFKNDPLKLYYWNSIYFNYRGEYSKSLDASRQHLREAQKSRINDELSKSYRILAKSHMYLNSKDSSLYYSNLSLNFARRSNSENAILNTFKVQAEVFNHFGMIGQSTSVLIKFIDKAEANRDQKNICWGTIQIAEKSFQIRYYNEAKTYYRKALSVAEKNNAIFFKSQIYRGLAEVSLALQEEEEAVRNLDKCIPLIKEWEESTNLPLTILTKAKILMFQEEYEQANNELASARSQFELLGDKRGIAKTLHLLGQLFFEQDEMKLSESYFKKSLALLQTFEFDPFRIENHRFLAEIYSNQKDYTRAYFNLEEYQKYTNINSSISSTKAINELTQMYSRELREYRIKEQEQVITNQKKEKELLALKSEKQFSTIILIVIILISIIIIVIFYFRQLKIKQQTQEIEMSQTLLRTQMNPHFIFNAMSVIQSYIYENDPTKSSKFLVSFSRLIRLILENSPKEFITIETEIDILDKYLKTQKLRFENRFDFKISAPEELIFKKVLIPPMITQPFVENSIEHGQLNIVENGHIHIEFKQLDNMLFVKIEDNGIGRKESEKKKMKKNHKSMALNITKERVNILNKKYKSKSSVVIGDLTQEKYSGTLVELYLPLLNENIKFD
ncbi:MAG: histidine kinase [Bacteroidota bacterium]|nr:histidine kinase [Bacteroidota bacterium]